MTEQPDPALSDAQRDRIARLAARRGAASSGPAPRSPRARRRHVAAGSRVFAAGFGAATMFGIVTVLGLDHPFAGADASPPPPTTPPVSSPAAPPIQVVIHRIPATVPPTAELAPQTTLDPGVAPDTEAPPEPIVLTATPVVQTVTVTVPQQSSAPRRTNSSSQASSPAAAPAPQAATTSGSN